jgi:hypothetical protein
VAGLGRAARLRDLWPTGLEPAWPGAPVSPRPEIEPEVVVLGYPGATTSMDPVAAPLSQVPAARLTNRIWRGEAFGVFSNIAYGESGGPIVGKSGRVVGMMFAIAFKDDEVHKQEMNGSVGFGRRARPCLLPCRGRGPPATDGADARVDVSVERFRDNIVRVSCYRPIATGASGTLSISRVLPSQAAASRRPRRSASTSGAKVSVSQASR